MLRRHRCDRYHQPPFVAAMHYRPGIEVVPGYRLQKMLGRGGFGEVWLAEGPGRVSAAVKIIDKVEDKAGRKEFRALKLIKDLRHPNLVSITGFWLKDADGALLDSDAYIDESGSTEQRPSELVVAMDLCEKSLLDRLAECRKGLSEDTPGGIPQEELLEYMEAAAKAIDYLNVKHQIQHRDIKPHNIMIVGGSAQVCDFGLASAISTARTSMGGAGSLAYMAPEIYSTKLPGPATDQYSLAITYCELRTGRLPLSDVESFAALDDAKRKGMLDLSLLDERERVVIERATSLDSAKRFPLCFDMVQEFRRTLSTAFSASVPQRAEPIAGYRLERSMRSRDGEEIWDAVDPDGLHVLLVVRNMHDAAATASWATLAAIREVSRSHPRLAEVYEFACLSATEKLLPARLFKLPNPPMPAKTVVAGRRLPRNLSERLSSGGMPIKRLLLLVGDLAEALDYLNAPQHDVAGKMVGFQHANLRPINFLVDDDHTVLSNFAGAQMLHGEEEAFPAGKHVAESAFTPPEFATERITRWSDQYMLAVSYLQLRTGKPSASLSSSMESAKRSPLGSRLDVSELKPTERDILLRATDADPRKRFATCREFVAALGQAWDEIIAAEPPPLESPKKKTSSAGAAAAATIDADSVVSASLSSLRDSAQTALDSSPPPARGATLVPSAIETRPPHDTDADQQSAPPRRIVDAPHTSARRPKLAAGKRSPPRPADSEMTPWWRTRGALAGAIAIAVLAVAIPVVLPKMFGGADVPTDDAPTDGTPTDDGGGEGPTTAGNDGPKADPEVAALQSEIERLVSARSFVAAFDKIDANRAKLGESSGRLLDELATKWSANAAEKAKVGGEKSDPRLLADAVAEAAALVGHFPASQEGRRTLVGAARAQIDSYKKQLAKAELPPADATIIVTGVEQLIGTLGTIEPADATLAATTASAKLVRGRAALRAGDPSKAEVTLVSLGPERLTDSRDKATWEALRALVDKKTSADLVKLESIAAGYRNRLDPWELGELVKRIEQVRGGELDVLKQQWTKLLGELRAKVAQGGASLAEARQRLADLSTANVAVWEYLTSAANTADYRDYRGLTVLATLRLDGLGEDEYAKALEDLNERVRGERVPSEAAALCRAALERALAMESALTYGDAKKTAEVQRLVGLTRSVATFAAGEFSDDTAEISKAVAEVDRGRVELAVARLRALRDAADFSALGLYAAGVEGVVGSSPPAAVLRAACAVECVLQEDKRPSPAQRDFLRDRQSQAADEDKHYVAFVAAISRQDTLADRIAATADAIHAAFTETSATSKWRDHNARKGFVVKRMEEAARKQAQGALEDLATPYYSPGGEGAQRSSQWLALAVSMFPPDRTPLNNAALRELRHLEALAAFYAKPPDADVGKKVVAWTDPLLAGDKTTETPLQVVLVNARSHALVGDRSLTAVAYGRLYDACRAATLKDAKTTSAPTPAAIDEHVLAPATAAITSGGDSAALSGEARSAAARLLAARGRYAHLHPSVQARVRNQLADEGSKTSVAKAAFDWFDAAVKFDATQAEYFYGRGYSCDLRTDMSYAERGAQMKGDATAALADGRLPKDFPAAHGLRGLGLLYESLTVADYDKKRKLLSEADAAYGKAIADCDALRRSPNSAAYADLEHDVPLLLVGRGTVLLQLANYESDPAIQEKLLNEALRLAISVTQDTTDTEEPKKLDGVHPEWAYQLAGNALEDFGWLLKRPEYYPRALVQFSKAEGAATRLDDGVGANLARYHRGRCRFKLGSDGYLSTVATLRTTAPAAGSEKARETLVADLRSRGGRALKDAASELEGFLANADAASAEATEARAFLARIRLTNVATGLLKSDEYDACMKLFDEAAAAAEGHAYSPLDRPQLLIEQANAAVSFAQLAAGRPADVATRFAKARDISTKLAADGKVDGIMRAKAHMMLALVRKTQATRAGEYRDEIHAALEQAVALAGAAGSADTARAARALRGEYAASVALRTSPRGAAENDALVGAADDYVAALEGAAPLSADRLQWGRDLAIVAGALDAAKGDYPQKAAYVKARPKYVDKVLDVAGQTATYASRFNRQEQVDFTAAAEDLLARATALAGSNATAAQKTALAGAAKTVKAARQRALGEGEFDTWWERTPPIAPQSAGSK